MAQSLSASAASAAPMLPADDGSMAPVLQLLPGAASSCIMGHLNKQDRQQFALACKHMRVLAIAAITGLSLTHKWVACKQHSTVFPGCSVVALKPRTMDELSKIMSALLLHQARRLPSLSGLQLDLQGVYDKHCDLSLIIKSIPLHLPQLTSLAVEQGAMLTAKAVKAMADLPLLACLTLKNGHGYEAGALAALPHIPNLSFLHLELLEGCSSLSSPIGPGQGSNLSISTGGGGNGSSSVISTPSEIARLAAADEVALSKCASRLVSFAAVNLGRCPSSIRAIQALLEAVAGSLKPRLARLVLANMPELPASCLDLVSGICSLSEVCLSGCDVAATSDLAKLSSLTGLTELTVAPQQPPAPVLASLSKGCRKLARLAVGAPAGQLTAVVMPSVTQLQLLAASPHSLKRRLSQGGSNGSNVSGIALTFGGMSVSLLKAPVQLSSVGRVLLGLRSLEVCGWAVDGPAVAALQQLEGLTSLKLQGGGTEPSVALHAKLLLPLLDMPRLARLLLLELVDLSDDWMGEAVRNVPGSSGSFSSVTELHLGGITAVDAGGVASTSTGRSSTTGAMTAALSAPGATQTNGLPSSAAGGLTISSSSMPGSGGVVLGGGLAAVVVGGGGGGKLLTDRGLVRLFACPRLQRLVLVALPGITLAGVKALVRGSSSLARMDICGCAAVSAAPPEVISRAAVAAPDRAVDLWVSP